VYVSGDGIEYSSHPSDEGQSAHPCPSPEGRTMEGLEKSYGRRGLGARTWSPSLEKGQPSPGRRIGGPPEPTSLREDTTETEAGGRLGNAASFLQIV